MNRLSLVLFFVALIMFGVLVYYNKEYFKLEEPYFIDYRHEQPEMGKIGDGLYHGYPFYKAI